MQYYYGNANILRALDEAEFWKHQESEHTVVVLTVTPDLEDSYVEALKEFGRCFSQAHSSVIGYVESIIRSKGTLDEELKCEMFKCIGYCIEQSKRFIDFLNFILGNSCAVKDSNISQTVIYHVIRESKYFIGIERLIKED